MDTRINDDRVLDARDMQAEIEESRNGQPQQREFSDVANEWLETLLEENSKADLNALALIFRLGSLGQRLIYEANAIGMRDTVGLVTGKSSD